MTDTTDLIRGFTALDEAVDGYALADRYASGQLPERFSTAKIREKLRGSGDAYRFRLARKPITALTNRVGISSITGGTEQVDSFVEKVRRANDMEQQEPFLIDRLATYGDAYWLVWPVDPEDEGYEDLPPDLREAGVKITYHSPYSTRAMYESEDGRDLQFVIRRWQGRDPLGQKRWEAEVWYSDRVEPWVAEPGASGDKPEHWHPLDDGEWPVPHDLGEIPFKHARTGLPYGRPQHADAYGPQDAITKLIVTQAEVDLEAHGFPERYRLVDEKAQEDAARDTVDWQDSTKAPAVDLQTSGRRGGPGSEQVYRATKAVGEFTSPDPEKLNPTLELWVRLMATVTDTPAWEFDPTSGDQLSGRARREAEKPLRAREENFKRYLLHFLRDTYRLACTIKGLEPGQIEVMWTPPEVESDPEWWAVARIRAESGVPQEEILTEAGYLPDQVTAFLDAKADERFWGERVRVLSELATALNTLSGPVSLGIVDAGKVAALVDRIMADAGERPIGGDGEADKPEPAPVQVVPALPGAEDA